MQLDVVRFLVSAGLRLKKMRILYRDGCNPTNGVVYNDIRINQTASKAEIYLPSHPPLSSEHAPDSLHQQSRP
jgi:hypothetical protein